MDKRELEIVVVSAKDLSLQTVASSNAKVYGIINFVNDFEFLKWETSEAEDVMNPKWDEVIKMVLDEDAIQHDSAHLLIFVCVKKENAMQDEEVGFLSLPLRSFLSHVGTLVVRDYPLESIQGPTLELGVKLSDKLIPDVSTAATQPTVISMPANSVVTPPAPLMSPYHFHSPPPANPVVTSPAPVNSVVPPPAPLMPPHYFYPAPPVNCVLPDYFHPQPPSAPVYLPHPYPPRPSFYQVLSCLQLLLQAATTFNYLQDFVMSTLGDGEGWGDWGAGSM